MKRTAFSLLLTSAAAVLAGCSNGGGVPDRGEEVVVQFGDGEASIYLHNLDVRQTEAGTEITAEVASDMPEIYTFRATVHSPGVFEAEIDNGAEVSHHVILNERELTLEFLRPSWERSESVGFLSAELMSSWLQQRVDSGSADCGQLPARFQDMPLQYVTTAILDHLVATGSADVDVARMQRVLCALAGDAPEDNGLGYPRGLAGWQALLEGRYLPPNLPQEPPASEEGVATGPTDPRPKNNCARAPASESVAATYDSHIGGSATTHIEVECGDAVLDVDANCCVDVDLASNSFGSLQVRAETEHPFCSGVVGGAGPTQYADFRFAAHAKICPSAPNSCWGDGHHDAAKPFTCAFSGYSNASEVPFDPTFGDVDALRKSGVAGWNFLQFVVMTCYEPGTDADKLYAHFTRVDSNRPDKLICWHDSIDDCYCAYGP